MPCTDPYAEEQSRRETVTNLHERTRMLCGLCAEIERRHNVLVSGDYFHNVEGLALWWSQHKKEDAKRREKERQARLDELSRKREELDVIKAEIEELEEEVKK